MYGGIHDPRMGPCRPRVTLALSLISSLSAIGRRGWRVHTLRGGFDGFRPPVNGVVDAWKDLSSGDGNLSSPGAAGPLRWPEGQLSPRTGSMSSPSQSAITQWGWRFQTLRGGIDPGDLRFRPQVVGVVDTWKDF